MARNRMAERTKAGLEAARRKGRIGGRQRAMTDDKIAEAKKLLSDGASYQDVSGVLGGLRKTLYRWMPASEPMDELATGSGS